MADTPTQEPADTYNRHGEPDPSRWEESPTVTHRPNDLVKEKVSNTTFAERAKSMPAAETKVVESDETEDKAVSPRRTRASTTTK